jgi:hypothetical protein
LSTPESVAILRLVVSKFVEVALPRFTNWNVEEADEIIPALYRLSPDQLLPSESKVEEAEVSDELHENTPPVHVSAVEQVESPAPKSCRDAVRMVLDACPVTARDVVVAFVAEISAKD